MTLCVCASLEYSFQMIFLCASISVQIHMVTDKDGKPRGYAFVEYERERDMNGKKCYNALLRVL